MVMTKRHGWTWVLAAVAGLSGLGCGGGDDGGGDNGGGAGAGTGGGAGAGAGGGGAGTGASGLCVNQGDPNLDCPEKQPLDGACAPLGECCHRASNVAKEADLAASDALELEYRINFTLTRNHPATIGADLLVQAGIVRSDNEEQSLLWRFKQPRANGMLVEGPGETTIGVGRYNCDGTYSFYDETAAPAVAGISDDVARWRAYTVPSTVYPDRSGRERNHIAFADNSNRNLVYTPFVKTDTFELEWELVNQGFDIREIDTEQSGRDCIGSRDGDTWSPGGTFEIYTPIAENDVSLISAAGGITYCQLVAFGVFATATCKDTPRCMPGATDCLWKKIPDALCPVTADDKTKWGCHLGALGNVNMEADYPSDAEINCTMEPPAGVLDPDAGPSVSKGQCCDPLGQSTTLPACNAFRLIQDYVAAAAEITDDRKNALQPKCE
jgi:hypothetical protein